MNIDKFDQVIEKVLLFLEDDCKKNPHRYIKSGENFEPCVKDGVDYALKALGINERVDYTPGGHGFPDIVIEGTDGNKFGIEVKSSTGKGKSWRINGNSVLGSTRVPEIKKNVIVFGKVRGVDSVFRAKEYEKCIANVVVTHSPRYLIDLDIEDGNSFFDKSNLQYSTVSESDDPIGLITEYFLSIGQTAWWLAESTPAAIQLFGKLPKSQQDKLMGYAFAHYPELFSNSGTKFYRYMSWLAAENSIVDSALRDRFTAGGKVDLELSNKKYHKLPHIFKVLYEHRVELVKEIVTADNSVLAEDWGETPQEDSRQRIEQWICLVASEISKKDLGKVKRKRLLWDIIFSGVDMW